MIIHIGFGVDLKDWTMIEMKTTNTYTINTNVRNIELIWAVEFFPAAKLFGMLETTAKYDSIRFDLINAQRVRKTRWHKAEFYGPISILITFHYDWNINGFWVVC